MSHTLNVPTEKQPNTAPFAGQSGMATIPALTIIWHPDRSRIGETCLLEDAAAGSPQSVSRLTPGFRSTGGGKERPLEDSFISRSISFTVIPRDHRRVEILPGNAAAAVEVQGAPLQAPVLITAEELSAGVILLVARQVVLCLHRAQRPMVRGTEMGIVGGGDGIERVRQLVNAAGASDVPVLIRGETGTGKEMVARAIVAAGSRSKKPFVAVNMAAVSPSTAVAEMFGHERGAFTGAAGVRRGYFGEAEGGTLLLDEFGLTPPELQRMLLRVLESGEFVPVGASRGRPANVRILAATDSHLEVDIASRAFSEPLFQRVAGFQIMIPALRERREDVGVLLLHFLKEELGAVGRLERLDAGPPGGRPWLAASQVATLAMGDWPGNIRGLRNAVRQMVIAGSREPRACLDQGTTRLMNSSPAPRATETRQTPCETPGARVGMDGATATGSGGTMDPAAFIEVFRRNRFSPTATAAELGIPRTTVYTLMERHPAVKNISQVPPAELRRRYLDCGGDLDRLAELLQVSRRGLQLRMSQIFKDAADFSETMSNAGRESVREFE